MDELVYVEAEFKLQSYTGFMKLYISYLLLTEERKTTPMGMIKGDLG